MTNMEKSKSKPIDDPQAVNKKIAERLLHFNKQMFKEKDGGGSDAPKEKLKINKDV